MIRALVTESAALAWSGALRVVIPSNLYIAKCVQLASEKDCTNSLITCPGCNPSPVRFQM